jgi:iron complex transport system substrate-binding protein
MTDYYPKRIVCLTEEPTETLYLLGEEHRIVGVSGFTVRPRRARKEKPTVSLFTSAKTDEIRALNPDLVIGFSDIQADIARQLIAEGVTVWVNNYRSVDGIFNFIVQMGALVGKQPEAVEWVEARKARIREIQDEVSGWSVLPTVYFEEWFDPLISSIQWVSELVELAGGQHLFPKQAKASLAKDRILPNPQVVINQNPDIIVASWCGKMFKPAKLKARQGWDDIRAVQANELHEIDSAVILQPGPAAVSEGLEQLFTIFSNWVEKNK